jgi:hypothetical protein
MIASRLGLLQQAIDMAGSLYQSDSFTQANEPLGLGYELSGQSGTAAVIVSVSTGPCGNDVTLTGLTGMTPQSIGNFIGLSGAVNAGNDGYFMIDSYISATSVTIVNPNAVAEATNLTWQEYGPYSVESDFNYARTDRSAIKGVSYFEPVPEYQRPTAIGTSVPANLANIAGKTTDAVAYNVNRAFYGVAVNTGDTFETISAPGFLKHADAVNETGVPCFDAAPFLGDWNSCYVHIVDGYQGGSEFVVLSGPHTGEVIFGITKAGASTSPNSVEVHFYSAPFQLNFATDATPYTWEAGQDGYANFLYGYNERLDMLDQNAFRTVPALGILVDAQLSGEINNILNTIGIQDGYNSLAGLLTNLGEYFPFYDLTATPTVVDALNVLNQQIGDTKFTGNMYGDTTVLVDGETVTFNLNLLGENLGSNTGYTGGSFSTGTVLIDGYSVTQLLQLLGSNLGDNTGYTGGNIVDGYSVTQSIEYLNQTIGYYGNFTGSVLNDGYSISQNLQQLANSIASSSIVRTIERLAADIPTNTVHTLPGGLSYTLDPENNGQNLLLFTRGLLRDPGPVCGSNYYAETSSTSVTFYGPLREGESINYLIK